MLRHYHRLLAVGLLFIAAARPLSAQPYFTGIGALDGGGVGSAKDISPEGLVVSGDTGIFGKKVVLWTLEGGLQSIMPREVADTTGGISSLGRVVVGGFPGNGTRHAFRWTEETGAVSLGDFPGGIFRSMAKDVSASGHVIVGYGYTEAGAEGFRWTEETGMVGLGDLPGGQYGSNAKAISAGWPEVIVGASSSHAGNEAYRWTAETGMVGLGDLPGGRFESYATAVSADGSVVVGVSSDADGPRGFRWTSEDGMVALDMIKPDAGHRVFGVSWDGNVIVGELTYPAFGPFYWTPTDGTRYLTEVLDEHGVIVPDGWILMVAYAVSADGRTIVGYGVNPDGFTEGWVAYLGPACRADFDDDGEVDASDVIAYIAAWQDHNIFADWNYDGSINTRDLLGFFNEWVAKPGCE